MLRRFRSNPPTSRHERDAARTAGQLKEMWFTSPSGKHSNQRRSTEEDEMLDLLESSVTTFTGPSASGPSRSRVDNSGSIDDMMAADIERMKSAESNFSMRGGKTLEDVVGKSPAVPRFRYVQGGIKKKGTQGLAANYER